MKSITLLFGISLSCAGCASYFDPQAAKVTKFGPQGVLQQPVEETDLVSLITEGENTFKVDPGADAEKFNEALDRALRKFYAGPQRELRRNRIQDRLLLASNDGCESFKTALQRKQATRNFEFGTATVLFGTAGAVVPGVQAAKNLSALSGASGGIRAEYNKDYFAEAAAHVIAKGINSRRKEILGDISLGQAKPIDQYSLESAIADVVVYHGACSLVGGLEYAEGAISKLNDGKVGLDVTLAIKDRIGASRDADGKSKPADADSSQKAVPGK